MKSPLEHLVEEVKQHDRGPDVSDAAWKAMEERLLAQITTQAASQAASAPPASRGPSRRLAYGVASVLAVAASVFAVVHAGRAPAGGGATAGTAADPHAISADPEAGTLREMQAQGAGQVRIRGAVATAGATLHAGDVLEAEGARAVLDRPQKVAWLLEPAAGAGSPDRARARVKAAGDALVVGLEEGAIEAQVVPVPQGEAFAVDVASGTSLVRVAVHGTHLRVAREGSRVTVDLNEGVVSIGHPPRVGSTLGTTVNAPSHVEFDAADLGTLRVDHAPAAVRPPVTLVPRGPTLTQNEPAGDAPRGPAAHAPAAAGAPVGTGAVGSRASASPLAGGPGAAGNAGNAGTTGTAGLAPPAPGNAGTKPGSRETIAQAVRACAASHGSSGSVRVTVSSSLELKVGAAGNVEAARFVPPLAPDVQTCAAAAIYQVKVDDAVNGSLRVPIELSY